MKLESFLSKDEPKVKSISLPKEPVQKQPKPPKEEKDDKIYVGYMLQTKTGAEVEEAIINLIRSVPVTNFAFDGKEDFLFLASEKLKKGETYNGLMGVYELCFDIMGALYFNKEAIKVDIRQSGIEFVEILISALKQKGIESLPTIMGVITKSSDVYTLITENLLETDLKYIMKFYYEMLESKEKAGDLLFTPFKSEIYPTSKSSFVVNKYAYTTELDGLETYASYFKKWVYESLNNSILFNVVNGLREKVTEYRTENNLNEQALSKLKTSIFLNLASTTNKILKGEIKEEDADNLYKAFNKALKLFYIQNGKLLYFDSLLETFIKDNISTSQLSDFVNDKLKVVIGEESIEVNELSTLFCDESTLLNKIAKLGSVIKSGSLKVLGNSPFLSITLSRVATTGTLPHLPGTQSPVFQQTVSYLLDIATESYKGGGVTYSLSYFEKAYGSIVKGFTGSLTTDETIEKRKYMLSIPIEQMNEKYASSFDLFTVLDTISTSVEAKKEAKITKITSENKPPFEFTTGVTFPSFGSLKDIFKVSDEVYFYLSEVIYKVIKEVYSGNFNSISEIVYDTNIERTKKAYDLLEKYGIFQKATSGAFYFYRDWADPTAKSIYGSYYTLLFGWFYSVFGIKEITTTFDKVTKNTLAFTSPVGIGSYGGLKDGKMWRGKGYGCFEPELMRVAASLLGVEPEVIDTNAIKEVKEKEFSVLGLSVQNISKNIPFLILRSVAIKYAVYYYLEKSEFINKYIYHKILFESLEADKFKRERTDGSNYLVDWDRYTSERGSSPLFEFGLLKVSSRFKGDFKGFSDEVKKFLANIVKTLTESFISKQTGELSQEFIEMAFTLVQGLALNGVDVKQAAINLNLPKFDGVSANDTENEILSKLSEEVYKDKIAKVTIKEERIDTAPVTPKAEKVTTPKEVKVTKKQEMERAKKSFLESISFDEDSGTDEIDF